MQTHNNMCEAGPLTQCRTRAPPLPFPQAPPPPHNHNCHYFGCFQVRLLSLDTWWPDLTAIYHHLQSQPLPRRFDRTLHLLSVWKIIRERPRDNLVSSRQTVVVKYCRPVSLSFASHYPNHAPSDFLVPHPEFAAATETKTYFHVERKTDRSIRLGCLLRS